MSEQLKTAIVRIFQSKTQMVVGTGFLIAPTQVMTCAHVVANALGIEATDFPPAEAEVTLDFPFVHMGHFLSGRIVCWKPVHEGNSTPPADGEDIAVLELPEPFSEKVHALLLVSPRMPQGRSFQVCGFPQGYQQTGMWVDDGRLQEEVATGWFQLKAEEVPGRFIEQGFSGAPIWDIEAGGVLGMVVAADRDPQVKTAFMIPSVILTKAWPPLAKPYRGLSAFREEDEPFFYGRDTFLDDELLSAVRTKPLVAVIGSSGSGKSSVVFAGLVPRLRREKGWAVLSFRPKSRPFFSLLEALFSHLEPQQRVIERPGRIKEHVQKIKNDETELPDLLRTLIEHTPDAEHLLLIVDQFEELYTLCEQPEDREKFLDRLLALSQLQSQGQLNCTLVLTLRADFLGHALQYRPFADALQHHDVKLGPMNPKELQQVIEEPAKRLGVSLETGLAQRILNALSREPGKLPLLEFALTLLWDQQRDQQMTLAAYETIGGVEKAIAQHAETIYSKLREPDQQTVQKVFIQLVRPGEGTEDTRRLATRQEVGEAHWPMVAQLANERLVVTGKDRESGEETVEMVHESLIREWERLQDWMERHRNFRVWQEHFKIALRQWENDPTNPDFFLRGKPLTDAEDWQTKHEEHFTSVDRKFIQASRKHQTHTQQKRRQLIIVVTAAFFMLIGGFGGFSYVQWQRAEQLQEQTAQQKDLALAAIVQLIYDVPERFINLPGAIPIVTGILEKNDQLLERILALEPDTQRALREKGSNYEKMGNQWMLLGNTRKALAAYQNFLKISQQLVQDTSNAQASRDLSISYGKLGNVYLKLGQTDQALKFYQTSLEIRIELAKDISNAHAQHDLLVSYDSLGNVYMELGKTAQALEFYQTSLEIVKESAQDTSNALVQRNLSVSYEKLGDVYLRLKQITQALEFYQNSLEIRIELAKDISNAQAQRDLSVSYEKLGDVYLRLKQITQALEFYQNSLKIRIELAKDTSNAQAQRDLSASYNRLGNTHLRLGQGAQALEFYQNSLEIFKELAQDTSSAQAQNDLRISYQNMIRVHRQLGNVEKVSEFQEKLKKRLGR